MLFLDLDDMYRREYAMSNFVDKKASGHGKLTVLNCIAFFLIGNFAFVPMAAWGFRIIPQGIVETSLVFLNLAAWLSFLTIYIARIDLNFTIQKLAGRLGISSKKNISLEKMANYLITDIERKSKALSPELLERKIHTKQDLSKALEQIVNLAYTLSKAESAELALFDPRLGMYHSSFVLGKPFKKSAQAMLSGAVQGDEETDNKDVIVQPIAFAGTILGSLRAALPNGNKPKISDYEIMRLLSVQGALAIVNGQYTSQLLRMQQVSEETHRAKTGFLANLSHEIRGPLGIMLNAVELVVDEICGPVTEDQLETLKMVRGNGEHLLELINDVLDYAKIEAGKLSAKQEDVLAGEVLKDVTSLVRKQADLKGHKLIYKDNVDILAFACDRRHLRQMLINLLTNAIKYTPDNGTIEVWADRTPGGRIRLNVKDSGVGIEDKDRSKVFSAFERIEHSYSLTQVGTGLGMPLTKKLVEVNGGQIDFSSKLGEGSHFWITFPAIKYNQAQFNDEESEVIAIKGKGESILLIESDANERKMMERFLESIGFKTSAVENKEDALEVIRTKQVELVIVDNKALDQINNAQIQEFRDVAGSSFLPIVLMTSRAFAQDIENFLLTGIDICLVKPTPFKELAKICRELIDGEITTKSEKEKSKPLRSQVLEVPK